jgi:Protein of unknown function (DUF3040)
MLSHDEHRHLRSIELWLEADDPALARMFRTHEPPPLPHQRKGVRIAVDVVAAVTFILGALTGTGVLIFFGALMISTGVCMHLAARH